MMIIIAAALHFILQLLKPELSSCQPVPPNNKSKIPYLPVPVPTPAPAAAETTRFLEANARRICTRRHDQDCKSHREYVQARTNQLRGQTKVSETDILSLIRQQEQFKICCEEPVSWLQAFPNHILCARYMSETIAGQMSCIPKFAHDATLAAYPAGALIPNDVTLQARPICKALQEICNRPIPHRSIYQFAACCQQHNELLARLGQGQCGTFFSDSYCDAVNMIVNIPLISQSDYTAARQPSTYLEHQRQPLDLHSYDQPSTSALSSVEGQPMSKDQIYQQQGAASSYQPSNQETDNQQPSTSWQANPEDREAEMSMSSSRLQQESRHDRSDHASLQQPSALWQSNQRSPGLSAPPMFQMFYGQDPWSEPQPQSHPGLSGYSAWSTDAGDQAQQLLQHPGRHIENQGQRSGPLGSGYYQYRSHPAVVYEAGQPESMVYRGNNPWREPRPPRWEKLTWSSLSTTAQPTA